MVSSRGEPVIDSQRGISLTPLHLGTRTTGAVGIAGPVLSRSTLEALGSMIGTTIEWYDFYLYATASALVFKPLFFPHISSTAAATW